MSGERQLGPALQRAHLDDDTLAALVADISGLTRILAIQVKGGTQEHGDAAGASLDMAVADLRAGAIRGVQIRYVWQDQEWCDTLIADGRGVRLVRVGPRAD